MKTSTVLKNIYSKGLALSLSKGFTLIELLIVIAVLGVLASVVLVAIDPVEQIRRGKDANRLQMITQLGHAASAYFVSQGSLLNNNPDYNDADDIGPDIWQTILRDNGDISSIITPPSLIAPFAGCWNGEGTSAQQNICYSNINTIDNFVIWIGIESKQYYTKAGNCSVPSQYPYFIYSSLQGKSGVACVAPTAIPAFDILLK